MKKGRGWFCHWLQHCHSDWLACQPSDTNVCFKAGGDTSGLSGSFFRGCLTSVYYTDSHVLIFLPLRPSLFLFLGLPALASVCVYTLCVAYFWVSVYERCRQRHVVSQLYLGPASCQRINKNKISTRRCWFATASPSECEHLVTPHQQVEILFMVLIAEIVLQTLFLRCKNRSPGNTTSIRLLEIFTDQFFLFFAASVHHLWNIWQQMLSISAFQSARCSVLDYAEEIVWCFFNTSILLRAWSLGEDISYPLLVHTAFSQELKPSPSNQQKVWGGASVWSCPLKVGDDSNCLSGATEPRSDRAVVLDEAG